MAFDASTDELLNPKAKNKSATKEPGLRIMRRIEEIEKLPPRRQTFVLKALDSILRGDAR